MFIAENRKYDLHSTIYVNTIGKIENAEPMFLYMNNAFIALLKTAAKSREITYASQSISFDSHYFRSALKFFYSNGFTSPLSLLVIFDSYRHSGNIFNTLMAHFAEVLPAKGGNEKKWISEYLNVRHNWLRHYSDKNISVSIYRTKCFLNEVNNSNWYLELPMHSQKIYNS